MEILIVEDELPTRIMLEAILQRHEYIVTKVDNGSDAWALLEAGKKYSIILTDWEMPGLSGVELLSKIRAREESSYPYTYVLLLTSRTSLTDKAAGFNAGADDYLTKPLIEEEILNKVQVGMRIANYEHKVSVTTEKIKKYAEKMEHLAQERAVQLVHADRMVTLGIMSAGIAHEINNPTSFISGNVQTIARAWNLIAPHLDHERMVQTIPQISMITEEIPNMIEGIKKGVERITEIVKGLKSYSRQDKSEKKEVKFKDVIYEAVEMCRPIKNRIDIAVSPIVDDIIIRADITQISQVIVNLATNAADALSGTQDPRMEIEHSIQDGLLVLLLRDNGPGIPEDILISIFDPFFTTKDKSSGTGLGLSISKGLIEEHDGSITVANIESGGACFTIILPLVHSFTESLRIKYED
ncbi:MAG: response regulator [Fibrobacterales bacterium]